ISDLVLWLQLAGGTPFGSNPADTLEVLRRIGVLRATGLAVHEVDYLLRGGSAAQSALAFTSQQTTALLQSIRDAIAKLTPAQQADAATISTIVTGASATAMNVTANIVTPLIARTSILPLQASTIASLLQSPIVDITQPQLAPLVAGVAAVARG